MRCEAYEEQISVMIDHELDDEQAGALFAHLGTCAACRRSLQSVLDLRSGLLEEMPPLAPKDLDARILKQWRLRHRAAADRTPVRLHLWTGRISLPVPVAAVILLFLIAGSLMVSSVGRQQQPMEGRVEAVYITTFPAVEVHGNSR
jgi:anti-sigma factor RsiW